MLLILPVVGALCSIAAVALATMMWWRGHGSIAARAHYSAVAAAGLAFAWWQHYWNLLGWHY